MSNIEQKIQEIREEIEKIKARNRRVEADKAWEMSGTRTVFIAVSTYILIFIFMILIKDSHPALNALVAALAYLLSTATYGIIKSWWLKRRNK